jgi:glucose/arabinose dehydrogenase
MYVNFTDTAGDTQVVEFQMSGGVANTATRRTVLSVDQPFANHNGGDLHFGPDGFLYITLGDGGSGGDPNTNSQNLNTLLGKILRINPTPAGAAAYQIPPGNPFVGRNGLDEIWDFGLRNPWRMSFDRTTGDLWIGDVGQGLREEVDFEPRGQGGRNWGWDRMEGSLNVEGAPPPGHVLPIFEYPHGTGGVCAVTGGYVYRGSAIPDLRGAYVFADFCPGQVMAFRQSGGRVVERAGLGVSTAQLSSFGQDAAGELYVLSLAGGVFKLSPA